MSTASDYDARRVSDDSSGTPLRELAPSMSKSATVVDDDPNDASYFELPGADLSGEELSASVIPQRADEFTCSCCFLVQHRSRLRHANGKRLVCADCA
ncbi:hypothetical protein MB901379_04582 [Mycobacterium basiliense]|uniref:dUTPase n=1 Tax=Mycobacterium basiliense TaxID=2094119 RepID=A0A447GKE3_9MYCO|nr:DUF4193 domain-containing protein [Mycobacterium basiliense]VDM90970.1 hypothetical protein MB901379_04582 [Mycobacterium basiliense]